MTEQEQVYHLRFTLSQMINSPLCVEYFFVLHEISKYLIIYNVSHKGSWLWTFMTRNRISLDLSIEFSLHNGCTGSPFLFLTIVTEIIVLLWINERERDR